LGNVGRVGGAGGLTVGTGTVPVGTGTLTLGRVGSALAGATTWPEPYPAPNTHVPMSNIRALAPVPLAMISH
jgi:hypothetical protein